MTEEIEALPSNLGTQTSMAKKEFRVYEVFERIRQGESIPEIAEDLGMDRYALQKYVQELAKAAREQSKELATIAFLTSHVRFEDLYKKAYELANDALAEKSERLKALQLCLGIQSRICDLHQVGRTTNIPASVALMSGEMTIEQATKECLRLGIPVPKDLTS